MELEYQQLSVLMVFLVVLLDIILAAVVVAEVPAAASRSSWLLATSQRR